MHRHHAPHLGRDVVIGACKLPTAAQHAALPKLAKYLDKAKWAPTVQAVSYFGPAMPVISDILANGTYGCCVESEDGHFTAVMTGNNGQLFTYTAAMVEGEYTKLTNFNPNDPSTDQGTDPIADLNYYLQNPYPDGKSLVAYATVDLSDQQETMWALQYLGNIKLWLALPDSYISPFPSQSGVVWDVASPNPANGHCIGSYGFNTPCPGAVVGANAQGIQVATWGLVLTMTWKALAALCVPSAGGGGAVRLSQDWINKQGGTPSGFSGADLASDLVAMGGTPAVMQPPGP